MHVSALNIYPVKSAAGIRLTEAAVVDTGFAHDREWMIVDENGSFISQRQYPKLAVVHATPSKAAVTLQATTMPELVVPIATTGRIIDTEVWTSPCRTIDQGDLAARWLQEYLGKPYRLVRMDPSYKRTLKAKYQQRGDEVVGFADRLPFLLTTTASLEDLNARLHDPVSMDRFRPNIVVAGATAFQEDTWKRIRIGEVTFRLAKACDRCEVTTVDQSTGIKGTEPLETLGAYRTQPNGIVFGQIMIHENQGLIHVDDTVEVLE